MIFCACLFALSALAQPGIDEMHQAAQNLSSSFFSAFDCSLVLAGLIGLCGAISVYHKWQMGKRDIVADIAAWFFAALFMVLTGAFLRALFGI